MKKYICSFLLAALCFFACKPVVLEEKPFLEAEAEMLSSLSGDGDAFNVRIRSNVDWTVSTEADWVILETTEGRGDAVVSGAVKRGVQGSERNCSIYVSCEEHKLLCEIRLVQGSFEPVIYHFTLNDLIGKASALEDGASVDMTEFSVTGGYVASDASAGNAPEGYVVITDNGSDYLRVVTGDSFAFGSLLELEMSNATLKKIGSGNYALEGASVSAREAEFPFDPLPVDVLSLPSFENCLVRLSGIQCREPFIGSCWSGDVLMEDVTDTSRQCVVSVAADAVFASESVVGNSGSVTGIVAGGKLLPRQFIDIELNGDRVGVKDVVKKWKPMVMLFSSPAANVSDNLSISGTVATFSEKEGYSCPGSISFGGGLTNLKFGSGKISTGYANTYITSVNWVEGAYLQYEFPISYEISGECEFFTSLSCAKPTTMPKFGFEWSLDGNSWHKMDAIYSYSCTTDASAIASAEKNEFSIPSATTYQQGTISGEFTLAEPVSSGSVFVRIKALGTATSLTQTLRLNAGCALVMKEADSNLSGASVLASENFASCRWHGRPVTGCFMGGLIHVNPNNVATSYSSSTGWSASNSLVRKGCLLFSTTTGELWLTSPALTMLSAPTDVTVTFKIAPYVTAEGVLEDGRVGVKVSGSGTVVGDLVYDSPLDENPFEWHNASVKVSGANADTQISIGKTATSAGRFYLDDVVIRR